MPLFMDRHDIQGSTADEAAQAHRSDLEVQARHHCRALTYWYDEPRGTAFCLVEAPSKASVHDMHREAHGLIPNQIIEVDASERMDLASEWGVMSVPTTFILDKSGRPRQINHGVTRAEKLLAQLKK